MHTVCIHIMLFRISCILVEYTTVEGKCTQQAEELFTTEGMMFKGLYAIAFISEHRYYTVPLNAGRQAKNWTTQVTQYILVFYNRMASLPLNSPAGVKKWQLQLLVGVPSII